MTMRVLTWNLFHGRSKPETRRSLLAEFSATLAGYEWDIALLQEVPPWWPVALAREAGASARMALTSRNLLPSLQRRVAHGVRLDDGTWVTNLHGQAHVARLAQADLDLAADAATIWAAGSPTILGGDLNLRGEPTAFGYRHLAGHSVDHVLGRGLRAIERGHTLRRGTLSDHPPLTVAGQPA